ncbi:hypothetical protein [Pseudonocardia sp. WMMC193]|uniref:hypothetical protein n=1 Tax=Pseudonocardia sp. WMMC193 TaxID=2911965 RepID=UPI001F1B53ED|nr:hypothetical protein [Pseudonocardia sp. WMMC193]MCF7548902.1 hypothetical protein [Pseudonocardia sp. WMMC193]
MAIHSRKIKNLELDIDGNSVECQVTNFQITNNAGDPEKIYTMCPSGVDEEEQDPDWSLQITFFADWRDGGFSDFLFQNQGEVADFTADWHPDIPEEHVRFTGQVRLRVPSVGGEVRTTETQELTLTILGVPAYTRVGA